MSEVIVLYNSRKVLDSDQIIKELNVDEKAQRDGKNFIPPQDATTPTIHECEIITFFQNAAGEEKNHIKDAIGKYKAKMSEIFHSRIIEDLHGLPEALKRRNNDSRKTDEQDIKRLGQEVDDRESTMKKFATTNGLKREPQPQNNPMQVTFWITAIVLLETALNATFFAVGSDRGLLGGAIQAFVISFLNVMGAWLLGKFCLPQLNHKLGDKKLIGAGCALMLIVGTFMLNTFAGHYRSALEEDAFKAVLMAVNSFRSGILSIKSAQGWLLSAVGGVAFTGLTIKIYFSDDPYPGYGKVYREYLRAQEAWLQKQKEFTKSIIANFDAIETTRAQQTDKLTELEVGYGVLLDKVRRLDEFHENTLAQLEGMTNTVINHYREENRHHRKKSRIELPAYFSQAVSLNTSDFKIELDLDAEEQRHAELIHKFEEYRQNHSARIKSELQDIHNAEIDKLDGFFGNA